MKIQKLEKKSEADNEIQRIVLKVGDAEITLTEERGHLKVSGNDSDLFISCGSLNSFRVITKSPFKNNI